MPLTPHKLWQESEVLGASLSFATDWWERGDLLHELNNCFHQYWVTIVWGAWREYAARSGGGYAVQVPLGQEQDLLSFYLSKQSFFPAMYDTHGSVKGHSLGHASKLKGNKHNSTFSLIQVSTLHCKWLRWK